MITMSEGSEEETVDQWPEAEDEDETDRHDTDALLHDEAGPVKNPLPRGRIFMLTAVLFFVGYSYAINEGFGVPLLLEAGLEERYAPFVLGISSIINVFLGGYLGSSSDRCKNSLGRRRPYIIGVTTLLLIAAALYPYGANLSDGFQLKRHSHTIYVILHTAFCVIIFDVGLDMTNALDRSYLIDSNAEKQSSQGHAMFSSMLSAGSFFGSLLAALDWESYLHLSNGDQTKVVFATVIVVLLVCVMLTINSVREPRIGNDGHPDITPNSTNSMWTKFICCNYFAFNLYDTYEDRISLTEENLEIEPERHELLHKTSLQQICKSIRYYLITKISNALYFIKSLSSAALLLWVIQLFEWMAMLSLLFFMTHFVGSIVFNGSPDAEPNSKARNDYNKGVRMGLFCQCIGFASSLFFSLFLYSKCSYYFKTRAAVLRAVYIIIHILTFLASGVLIFSKSFYLVASFHVIFGCFYSWILIIPFTLLETYEKERILFRKEIADKHDTYGRVTAFIYTSMYVAQIILSFSMGSIIKAYGSAAAPMIIATITAFLASIIICFLPMQKKTSCAIVHSYNLKL